jgi:hypothetical protein
VEGSLATLVFSHFHCGQLALRLLRDVGGLLEDEMRDEKFTSALVDETTLKGSYYAD